MFREKELLKHFQTIVFNPNIVQYINNQNNPEVLKYSHQYRMKPDHRYDRAQSTVQ